MAYQQVFVDREYDFLVDTEPRTIVDAGANIGLASILFTNRYPGARIIALEPEQSNFQLLKENVAPYPNVIPVHAALWNRNEELNLVDPGIGKWGFRTEAQQPSGQRPVDTHHTVMAMTVDSVMETYGLDRIDILKVDIEGAEKEVFSDTSSWIQKVDSIVIELHEPMKVGCNRSFYCGSNGFDQEWLQGENVVLSRGNRLARRAQPVP